MARRSCANCRAKEWPRFRYCEDCWLAFAKAAAAVIGAQLTFWIVRLLLE